MTLGLVALAAPAAAQSPQMFSPAWFGAGRSIAAPTQGKAGVPSAAKVTPGGGVGAAPAVQQSLKDFANAASAIARAQSAQTAAQAAAQAKAASAASAIPNGLAPGGLQLSTAPSALTNATAPVATVSGGQTTVTVKQTAPRAIANWSSFNVGARTTLDFDQSAGGTAASTWAILNRVAASVAPSQILGHIQAQGQVLILNQNGVIFGAGSQVNVGSLLVATAELAGSTAATNARFLSTATGAGNGVVCDDTAFACLATAASADVFSTGLAAPAGTGTITVEAGASITANAPSGGATRAGSILLLASDGVSNAGQITANDGQIGLAAAQGFILRAGYSPTNNPTSSTLGVEIAQGTRAGGATEIGGTVANTGLLQAATGDITLVGNTVTQAGTAVSTTSVNQRGTIHLLTGPAIAGQPAPSVTLAAGATTTILLDTSGATATDAQRQTDIATSAANARANAAQGVLLNNQSTLADLQYESRVEITSGGAVDFAGASLTLAPGGQIAVAAGGLGKSAPSGSILVQAGAVLDTAGATQAVLPANADALQVNIQGNELRDAPVNRDTGTLNSTTAYVNVLTLVPVAPNAAYVGSPYGTGAGEGGTRQYTPGGLLEVSGELANVTHTIAEWSAPGGTIAFAGGEAIPGSGNAPALTAAAPTATVVTQPGSVLNVAGGAITYAAGNRPTTYLRGADGRVYDVDNAPANLLFTGVYTGPTQAHPRWGVTEELDEPLITPTAIYQSAYTVGRDAGTVSISAATLVLGGAIDAGVVTGANQTAARDATLSDPYQQAQAATPVGGTLAFASANLAQGVSISSGPPTATASVTIGDMTAASLAAAVTPTTPLTAADAGQALIPAATLTASGAASLSAVTTGGVTLTNPLTLAPGGAVTLTAPTVSLAAPLTAPGATVTVNDTQSFTSVAGASTLFLTPPTDSKVTPGVTLTAAIDTRGLFTNEALDPTDTGAAAYVNGGSVSFDSFWGITLAPGSAIDTSSGGFVSAKGGVGTGGRGGSISLNAYDEALAFLPARTVPVTGLVLGGTLTSDGVAGGGTLSLAAPSIRVTPTGTETPADGGQLVLSQSFFAGGFSAYSLTANILTGAAGDAKDTAGRAVGSGIMVDPGTTIAPLQQVLFPTPATAAAPTGTPAVTAFTPFTPPLYISDAETAATSRRAPASVALATATPGVPIPPPLLAGGIIVAKGAAITVDPGSAITITSANGPVSVDGALTAPSGAISVVDTLVDPVDVPPPGATNATAPLAVTIGPDAVLNAAAPRGAALGIATDTAGRPFGSVPAGGSITLGNSGTTIEAPASTTGTTSAFVVVQRGAVLDVSGSAATIDLDAGQGQLPSSGGATATTTLTPARDPVLLASAGGTITVNSESGILLDGTLRAASGGPGAAGGTFNLALRTPSVDYDGPAYFQPRTLIIAQSRPATGLTPTACAPVCLGQAQLYADELDAAGFDTLRLGSGDYLGFAAGTSPDITLRAGSAITLTAGPIFAVAGTEHVTIEAPYVALEAGTGTGLLSSQNTIGTATFGGAPPAPTVGAANTSATFSVVASEQIDISGAFQFPGFVNHATTTPSVSLATTGDLRFDTLPGYAQGESTTPPSYFLSVSRDITLTAAQVYPVFNPVSGQMTEVLAGFSVDNKGNLTVDAAGTITIDPASGSVPALPLTVGGTLAFYAQTVIQDGVVRAPLGQIIFGPTNTLTSLERSVTLGAGSITSVSAAGLTVPFGGTTDGILYSVNGTPYPANSPGLIDQSALTFLSQSVTVLPGATVDLRGGGTLAGEGFTSGRGGSTDILQAPLLSTVGGTVSAPAPAANPVYAIIPGYSSVASQTPIAGANGFVGATPAVGEQITIGATVPGLPAGTYTLLPGTDALLPGAYRVQLGAAASPTLVAAPVALGNRTTLTTATTSIAGTPTSSVTPITAIVSPAAAVRNAATYDEETLSQYVVAYAAQYGNPRQAIPEDTRLLQLLFPLATPPAGAMGAAANAGTIALQISPGTVEDAPASGGFGGTVLLSATTFNQNIVIAGETTAAGPLAAGTTYVLADALDALDATLLEINGQLTTLGANAGKIIPGPPGGSAGYGPVEVTKDATLRAGTILFVSQNEGAGLDGQVTIDPGATLSTIGLGTLPYDSTAGIAFNPPIGGALTSTSVVALSNSSLIFTAPFGVTTQVIDIGDGPATTGLFAGGTVTISTPGSFTLGSGVRFGAGAIDLASTAINFEGPGAAPANAPPGLVFTEATLQSLTAGGAAPGVPPLASLTLSATGSVNIYGSLTLGTVNPATGQSSLASLELNTPAIYGAGAGTDAAVINAGSFIWNGLADRSAGLAGTNGSGGFLASTQPPAIGASGPGTGSGTLTVNANNIVLGYGPTDPPPTVLPSTTLNRALIGFSSVTLNAAQSVSFNHTGTLSVYQAQGAYSPLGGFTGTGGALAIDTPLLTGASGATGTITAGGALTLAAPAGTTPATAATGQGATLTLNAASLADNTSIILPAGLLAVNTTGPISLGAASRIDVSGQTTTLIDQTLATPGGTIKLASAAGDITQAANGQLLFGAPAAAGGELSLTATGGTVALGGTANGATASGNAGSLFTVRAGTLDYAATDAALTAGGVSGERSFDIGTGDVTIADTLAANTVSVSVDAGSLTVTGTVDATGASPGAITLAAANGLTLAPSAVLDARETAAHLDSAGAPIPAENAGAITLAATGASTLTLSPGATLAGGATASAANAGATWTLTLEAPRSGANDVAIDAAGPLTLIGAPSVSLYAMRTYAPTDAPTKLTGGALNPGDGGTVSQHASGVPGSVNLDTINADSTAFTNAALANTGLATRLAGLGAPAAILHPGVEIDSSAASGGNLTVRGDLDLSGYRYGPGATGNGQGQAGLLVLRAANNLNVYGSITDGFSPPPDIKPGTGTVTTVVSRGGTSTVVTPAQPGIGGSPDDGGWLLLSGVGSGLEPFGQTATVPVAVTLLKGTSLYGSTGGLGFSTPVNPVSVNYPVALAGNAAGTIGVLLLANNPLPANATFSAAQMLPAGTVLQGTLTGASGAVLAGPGAMLTTIPAGATLSAGSRLSNAINLPVGYVWPAGAPLTELNDGSPNPAAVYLAANTTLLPGDQIPYTAILKLGAASSVVNGATCSGTTCSLRPNYGGIYYSPADGLVPGPLARGAQPTGSVYALSQLLPLGPNGAVPQSWSLRLVGGADLGAASSAVVLPASSFAATGADAPTGSVTFADPHYQVIEQTTQITQTLNRGRPVTTNTTTTSTVYAPSPSVVRTGTGTLDVIAGGNVAQASLYGIYTAGARTAGSPNIVAEPPGLFTTTTTINRPAIMQTTTIDTPGYDLALIGRAASFASGGGNLTITAQGNVGGDVLGGTNTSGQTALLDSDLVSNWTWRQAGAGLTTAWWVNYGSYVPESANIGAITGTIANGSAIPTSVAVLTGFTGYGALGGGNVSVTAGGDAGVTSIAFGGSTLRQSNALVVAAGSSGYVNANDTVVTEGGGDLTLRADGRINPYASFNPTQSTQTPLDYEPLEGTLTDLRGTLSVTAGALGSAEGAAMPPNAMLDPRATPYTTINSFSPVGGLQLVLGDATAAIETRGDAVFDDVGDATRLPQLNPAPPAYFSLWQPGTAVSVISAGGNTTNAGPPTYPTITNTTPQEYSGFSTIDDPAILNLVAVTGNVDTGNVDINGATPPITELAPSPIGQLEVLAGTSIFGNSVVITLSSTNSPAATPLDPLVSVTTTNVQSGYGSYLPNSNNDLASGTLHANDLTPALIYAGEDIVALRYGNYVPAGTGGQTHASGYQSAKAARIIAGRDIVSLGQTPDSIDSAAAASTITTAATVILNNNPTDVSVIQAGRDIIYPNVEVVGPGQLYVQAGRNLSIDNLGQLVSVGAALPAAGTTTGGAGITALAGVGAGPHYAAFARAYLDPADLANPADPLDSTANTGKVAAIYQAQLLTFLAAEGYTGDASSALAYFLKLPAATQATFLLPIYFDELRLGGREFTNPASPRYKSYVRGRDAIATLFPTSRTYSGQITQYSTIPGGQSFTRDGRIVTQFGGGITLADPGGEIVLGAGTTVPGGGAGVLTQGSGDIDIYAQDSVLLAQSRVFTTFGGGITIWSATGDINAGRGAKSTAVFNPPLIGYDSLGDVIETPPAQVTGAGIATLAPVAGTPPGDLDLIAPLGTIDAGEAGIRATGNANFAALAIVNAANVQVQGKSSGLPQVAVPNIGALTAASAAAAAASNSAEQTATRAATPPAQTPSDITVEVLGF